MQKVSTGTLPKTSTGTVQKVGAGTAAARAEKPPVTEKTAEKPPVTEKTARPALSANHTEQRGQRTVQNSEPARASHGPQQLRYREERQYDTETKTAFSGISTSVILIALAIVVYLIFLLMRFSGKSQKTPSPNLPNDALAAVITSEHETVFREVPEFTTAPETEETLPFSTETEPPETEATEPPAPATVTPLEEYTQAVTETPPIVIEVPTVEMPPAGRVAWSDQVGEDYFTDCLFIGDSRTVGLWMYSGIKEATFYAQQSLNVTTAMTKSFITTAAEKEKPVNERQTKTLAEALEEENWYKYIYVSFGINEFMYMSTTGYIKQFRTLISIIRERVPDAVICVQSVIPLAAWKVDDTPSYKQAGGNGKIAEYNNGLLAMCEEDGLYYIDLCEPFADENGDLGVDSSDGIHFGVSACQDWAYYLSVHAPWYIAPQEED